MQAALIKLQEEFFKGHEHKMGTLQEFLKEGEGNKRW